MKNLFLVTLIFCVLNLPIFAGDNVLIQIAKGDSLYKLFDNEGALQSYLAALELDSMNYEANWKAARAYTDVGETIDDDDERADFYFLGSKYAFILISAIPSGKISFTTLPPLDSSHS